LVSAPETAPQIGTIVIGSTIKGLITGVLIGYFSQKVHSLALGILFGLAIGAFLAFLVALLQYLGEGKIHFWQIMLPGAALGVIVGYATQKYGSRAAKKP
jgi:ABC-type Fe3+-siderophore transport system permease subunit